MNAVIALLIENSLRSCAPILAVLLLRAVLHKLPKRYLSLLWCAAWLRLALPFALRSRFSLLPGLTLFGKTSAPLQQVPTSGTAAPGAPGLSWLSIVWLAGLFAVLLFALVRFLLLRRRVREAVPLRDGLWLCDWVETPFLLGLFRPRIFLPSGIDEADIPYVEAHETAHLRRGDPWRKLAAFLLAAVYWFHPLVWAAFFLYRRDIELACDERASRDLGPDGRNAYAGALMRAAERGRSVWAATLSFGGAPVKKRALAVLHPPKCRRFPLILAAIVCAGVLLLMTLEPARAAGTEAPSDAAAESPAPAELPTLYMTSDIDQKFGSGSKVYVLRCGDALYVILGDDVQQIGTFCPDGFVVPDPKLPSGEQATPWWAQNGDFIPADGNVWLVWEEGKVPMYAINDNIPPGTERHYFPETSPKEEALP